MKRQYLLTILLLGFVFFPLMGNAQTPPPPRPTQTAVPDLGTDVLSAKVLLEDLIVKRYAQDLSTRLDKDSFNLSSHISLGLIAEEEVKAQEPIDDLMLGSLDPEALMKQYAGKNANEFASSILSQYRMTSVHLTVGVRVDLGEEQLAEIKTWLDQRLAKEFGPAATGEVIKTKTAPPPAAAAEKEPDFLDQLSRFQSLAGQALLALALLLGALVWGLLANKKSAADSAGGKGVEINMNGSDGARTTSSDPTSIKTEARKAEEDEIREEVKSLQKQIDGLVGRLGPRLGDLVNLWCRQGESGRLRLACFAEATGKTLGSMPIPVDAVADVTQMFMQMPNVNSKEKRETLQKTYWDLVAMLNLGPDALNQPFSYVGGLNVDSVNHVLMEQNPKMKTLVTLFMPSDLRGKYLKNLPIETKRELLRSAADLSEIPSEDLKAADRTLAEKIQSGKGTENIVRLEMTVQKIVSGLTPIEEVTLLPELQGPSVQIFKRTQPSLAFVAEWTDSAIQKLVSRTNVDELVAFLRLRPDLSDRFASLAPSMTARMLKDELSRPDVLSDNDKNRLLTNMVARIQELRDAKEIDLETLFSVGSTASTDQAA